MTISPGSSPARTHLAFGWFKYKNQLSSPVIIFVDREPKNLLDTIYVEIYLQELALFIIKFGYDKVFNMDETTVMVNNCSVLTLGKKKAETVTVDSKTNGKECITALGTCTRSKTYTLILLNKWTRRKHFEPILRSGNGTEVSPTGNNEG